MRDQFILWLFPVEVMLHMRIPLAFQFDLRIGSNFHPTNFLHIFCYGLENLLIGGGGMAFQHMSDRHYFAAKV